MSFSDQKHVLAFSPFLEQLTARHPQWLEDLRVEGRLENTSPPGTEELASLIQKTGLDPALRQFRNREMMRLIWRDLNGLAPVDEILSDLSTLADLCLHASVCYHSGVFEEKYGTPRSADGDAQKLIVIGLGKLGGCEPANAVVT